MTNEKLRLLCDEILAGHGDTAPSEMDKNLEVLARECLRLMEENAALRLGLLAATVCECGERLSRGLCGTCDNDE